MSIWQSAKRFYSVTLTTLRLLGDLYESRSSRHYIIGPTGSLSFGWDDETIEFVVRETGPTAPTYGVTAYNFKGYRWPHGSTTEIQGSSHIKHRYAIGTKAFPHIHFRPLTNAAGTVRWKVEWSVSKGHGQQAGLPAPVVTYIDFAIPANSQYTHFIAEVPEVNAIPSTHLEPDSVVHLIFQRVGGDAVDTYPDQVWAWTGDLHLQVNRESTLNRSPDFYN